MDLTQAVKGIYAPGAEGAKCRGFLDGLRGATRNPMSTFQAEYDAGFAEGDRQRHAGAMEGTER